MSYRELAPLLGEVDSTGTGLLLECGSCGTEYRLNLNIIEGTVNDYGEFVFYLCKDCSLARGLWSNE